MTRDELLDLFTPIYDEFAMIAFDEPSLQNPLVFDVKEDPTKDFIHNQMSALGAWDEVDEDSDSGLDHFIIGYEETISHKKFRKYFYVSFEVNDQIEYAELEKKIIKAEALGRGGRARAEMRSFAILSDGFATAGPDGQFLFDTDHPKNPEETGIIYDNLLVGPFSHDNLELAEAHIANNHFDMDGMPIMVPEKPILLYPPAINGKVSRVLSDRANERPDTDKRDINIYAGKYTPVECPWISNAMGGSDTAWFIIYPGFKSLKFIWGQKPKFSSWIENLLQRYYFDGWEHFECGPVDWRGLFGSTGL